MKKSKAILSAIVAVVMTTIVSFSVAGSVLAYSCPEGTIRAGDEVTSPAQCNVEKDGNFATDFKNIINWIVGIAGLVAVVVIIIGGITYMTSNGDPGKIKKGKDTILYGIIGLVICALAFAIVNFVVSGLFGTIVGRL